MLLCMLLSIAFLLADIIVTAANLAKDSGINPYWRVRLPIPFAPRRSS